jgi:hypothetical protein
VRRGPIAILLLCALLVALAMVWLIASSESDREAALPELIAERDAAEPPELTARMPPESDRVQLDEPAEVEPAEVAPAPAGAFVPGPRPRGTLQVEVVDHEAAPVPAARLELRSDTGPRLWALASLDERRIELSGITDAAGEAFFEDLPAGPYVIRASGPRRAMARRRFALTGSLTSLRLALEPALHPAGLLVRVVDDSGAGVARARVEMFVDDIGRSVSMIADGEGIARFAYEGIEGAVVMAFARDGRVGTAKVWRRDGVERAVRQGGIEVVVGAAGVLHGLLNGLAPTEFAGARVLAYALDNSFPYHSTRGTCFETPVTEGRYRFESLPAGTWSLELEDPAGARLALPPLDYDGELENSVDPIEVEVRAGEEVELDLEVRAGGVIEGLVRMADGTSIEGALVRTTYAPRTFPDGFVLRGAHVWRYDSRVPGDFGHPAAHASTRSGPDGSYRFAGLQPGRHRLEVIVDSLTYDRLEGVAVEDGQLVRLEHVLEPAGEIQGVNPGGGYLGAFRAGAEDPAMVAILPDDGRFAFAGLAPGDWRLAQLHSDAGVAPVELAVVRVEAGRTTWVDLSEVARPIRISGVVIDDAGPVAGARVKHYPRTWITDAFGRFSTSLSFAPSMWFRLSVERDGIETTFEPTPLRAGEREWVGELRMGSERLRLRTFDAHGVPVAARVELQSGQLEPDGTVARSIRAERLEVPMESERSVGGLVRGEYHVTARFANGARAYASARVPASEPLVLHAPAAGGLTVRVRSPGGDTAAGVEIMASTWIGEGPAPEDSAAFHRASAGETTYTDAEGRAVFRGVAAGDVLVVTRDERCSETARERLRLGADESLAIDLVLPR